MFDTRLGRIIPVFAARIIKRVARLNAIFERECVGGQNDSEFKDAVECITHDVHAIIASLRRNRIQKNRG